MWWRVYLTLAFVLRLEASHQTNQVKRKVSRRETPASYLHLPVFVESRQPLVNKKYFSPAKGTGQEPLPEHLLEVLLPVLRPSTSPPRVPEGSVRTFCKLSKMHVKVEKSILGGGITDSQVRLGTCQASKSTSDHLYFEYDLSMCGTKRTVINNQVVYSNTLKYDPPRPEGPIRRAVPFTLSVACYYNRYQYSYKIGYTPKMRMRKIFKPMTNRVKFILTARNAQWERLSLSDQYVLGKPMYFQAETSSLSQDERLYIHSCYVTPEKSHTSKPQFLVVSNFGCMVESRESRSRFIPYKNNAIRFSVDAFLFKGMTGQLYVHCTMSVGSSIPSPTAKSCSYDTEAERWVELYGSDEVCTCCDSNCSSTASIVTKTISSRPWTIKTKVKPSTALPETTREVTLWRITSQSQDMGQMEEELEWTFGGAEGQWAEVAGEEKWVKGSDAVEKEVVTEPRKIFEEIFYFDK
ncbi:zona pellucida sperm-binding protein 3d.2 [Mastacembelus armatus]|uniref:zona pellucida sperm-binding protein 3d.2 n=1 Tax=Mastacembelus armatus TaxID=205130 RepID=UPI001436778E|nr:zona pellucida sperm-binding protein 3-like [Mastacembelus armatus]